MEIRRPNFNIQYLYTEKDLTVAEFAAELLILCQNAGEAGSRALHFEQDKTTESTVLLSGGTSYWDKYENFYIHYMDVFFDNKTGESRGNLDTVIPKEIINKTKIFTQRPTAERFL